MSENALAGVASILVLGVLAECLAARLRVPSILVLMLCGLAVGPLTGILRPDELFGDLLAPLVSLAVGVLLFDGGLGLRLADLKQVGRVLRNLLTVGMVTNWLVMWLAAYWLAGLELGLAAVLGAVLVVTGPTVIGPLLRYVRPRRPLGSILRWEGIVIDPLGAAFAVLVFEAVFVNSRSTVVAAAVLGLVRTLSYGGVIGLVCAGVVIELLRRHWLPQYLDSAVTLMMVVGGFAAAETLQPESGLLAATVMGIALANQRKVNIRHIVVFKETVSVLLISGLFVLLAARLRRADLLAIDAGSLAFVFVVILIARPTAVWLSTLRSGLSWRERAFLAGIAPRGIVAAAVSSIFTLELAGRHNLPGAERLAPLAFLAVFATVVVCSVSAGPLGRWLGVAERDPQGFLVVGAHAWARRVAALLQASGVRVLLVDSNHQVTADAALEGLEAHYGSILAQGLPDELDLHGIGRLLALTQNDEVNALACLHFASVFGSDRVFQLATPEHQRGRRSDVAPELRGRELFDPGAGYDRIQDLCGAGYEVKATYLTEAFDYDDYREFYRGDIRPMFVLADRRVAVVTADATADPRPGDTVVSLVPPDPAELRG